MKRNEMRWDVKENDKCVSMSVSVSVTDLILNFILYFRFISVLWRS